MKTEWLIYLLVVVGTISFIWGFVRTSVVSIEKAYNKSIGKMLLEMIKNQFNLFKRSVKRSINIFILNTETRNLVLGYLFGCVMGNIVVFGILSVVLVFVYAVLFDYMGYINLEWKK